MPATVTLPFFPQHEQPGMPTLRRPLAALALALAFFALLGPQGATAESLLNVSYDPTRELYRDINAAFTTWWTAQGNACLLYTSRCV